MDFVFEERKGSGKCGDLTTPKTAAVRVTVHKNSIKGCQKAYPALHGVQSGGCSRSKMDQRR